MKEIILIKNGEIALKGLNRSTFEDAMIKNIRRRMAHLGKIEARKAQSTVTIAPQDEFFDMDAASDIVSKVFGVSAFCRACEIEKDMSVICKTAAEYLKNELEGAKTFKVIAKRSDKKFPLTSPEICREVGGYLLSKFHNLKVDVIDPEVTVVIEIRDKNAYIHSAQTDGAGGIPTGTGGRAMLLISGGIDSPVAGYMMAKRGLEITAIHFASPPYTSERALEKVKDLLRQMAQYCGRIKLYTVSFTEVQEQIRDRVREEYSTLVMRRFMMRIANKIAEKDGSLALITGESLGQVASQTLPAICCTDAVSQMPVFRPLIGMDKEEIVAISRKIDTFDISVQPFEDCCTVFTPKHPKTKPNLSDFEKVESVMDIDALVNKAAEETRYEYITAV
ncbi:MAG: tRNA 4-thiouridine(8) synthase ThiI [Ruminococcaceae bacterium]|nr:tRNA 4-thiouridine(8) synthase ThiI [Oscillospiraceae bacterium]